MTLVWSRPDSPEYPKVWCRFIVNGVTYIIKDLPPSMNEKAIQFIRDNYNSEEPLIVAFNLHRNPFFTDYSDMMFRWEILRQRAALVCVEEGKDEIVGINMNYVITDYDTDNDIRDYCRGLCSYFRRLYRFCTNSRYTWNDWNEADENTKQYQNVIEYMMVKGQEENIHCDRTLIGGGLCVATAYRGRGIGEALLRAREPFCKEFDIPMTMNVFTSDSGIRCAEKAGFKDNYTVRYDEITDIPMPAVNLSTLISFRYIKFDEVAGAGSPQGEGGDGRS